MIQRRGFLGSTLFGILGLAFTKACKPTPGPNSPVVTPQSVITVVDNVLGVLSVILPILVPFMGRFIPVGAAKVIVLAIAAEVVAIGGQWQAVAQTYRDRGGDACMLYALSGALIDALQRLARGLVLAGFSWGTEISALIGDLGLLLDRLIGHCATPGVDAGALASTGRAHETARATLQQLGDDARARGVMLRPLPPITPESLR